MINEITQKCSAESVNDDKQKAIVVKLNSEARRKIGESENKALYFSDCNEKEITAIVGYKYDCFSGVYDDIVAILKKIFTSKCQHRTQRNNR